MLRILKGEQDVRKSIVHVNNVLVSYPDLEVYKVPEVYDTINRFIPQHCMDGVYCFLKTSSVEVCHFFVDQKSSSSIQCAEICLFWKALQPDFINVMISSSMNPENVFAVFVARALLGHFQGMKEISSRLLRFVKDSLHQSGFEKLFKSEIFRIIAFILLMSFELALEPSGIYIAR